MQRSKFTQARRDAIVAAIQAGHPIPSAAGMAGLAKATVYDWLNKGEKEPGGQYGAFAQAVAEAQSQAADFAIGSITRAMPDDWRAAMEFLSRRFPDEWAKRERHEVTGAKGEPIKVELVWPTGVADE